MIIPLEEFKGKFEQEEERINDLKERSTEIIQCEKQKEERMKKIKRISEMCGTVSNVIIHIM